MENYERADQARSTEDYRSRRSFADAPEVRPRKTEPEPEGNAAALLDAEARAAVAELTLAAERNAELERVNEEREAAIDSVAFTAPEMVADHVRVADVLAKAAGATDYRTQAFLESWAEQDPAGARAWIDKQAAEEQERYRAAIAEQTKAETARLNNELAEKQRATFARHGLDLNDWDTVELVAAGIEDSPRGMDPLDMLDQVAGNVARVLQGKARATNVAEFRNQMGAELDRVGGFRSRAAHGVPSQPHVVDIPAALAAMPPAPVDRAAQVREGKAAIVAAGRSPFAEGMKSAREAGRRAKAAEEAEQLKAELARYK